MASRSNKLSRKRKLKALKHGEDHDEIYVDTFDTINREFDSLNYEDGHDFEGFYVDSDFDFEGFHCNEGGNLKEYKEKFINMLQNLEEEEEEENLELNNYVDFSDFLHLIPKPLEDIDEKKAVEVKGNQVEDIDFCVVDFDSRHGNDLMTDSSGHIYSYWRETGGMNKEKHYRCINSDCPSYLIVYNDNEENMKVSTSK